MPSSNNGALMLQIKWLRTAERNPIAAQNFIQEVYDLTNLLRTARAAVHLSTAHLQADMRKQNRPYYNAT
jgi:hypothetical protein